MVSSRMPSSDEVAEDESVSSCCAEGKHELLPDGSCTSQLQEVNTFAVCSACELEPCSSETSSVPTGKAGQCVWPLVVEETNSLDAFHQVLELGFIARKFALPREE